MSQNPTKERKLTISLDADLEQRLHAERQRLAQATGLPRVSMNAAISALLHRGLEASATR